jgi:hypothetical protein
MLQWTHVLPSTHGHTHHGMFTLLLGCTILQCLFGFMTCREYLHVGGCKFRCIRLATSSTVEEESFVVLLLLEEVRTVSLLSTAPTPFFLSAPSCIFFQTCLLSSKPLDRLSLGDSGNGSNSLFFVPSSLLTHSPPAAKTQSNNDAHPRRAHGIITILSQISRTLSAAGRTSTNKLRTSPFGPTSPSNDGYPDPISFEALSSS